LFGMDPHKDKKQMAKFGKPRSGKGQPVNATKPNVPKVKKSRKESSDSSKSSKPEKKERKKEPVSSFTPEEDTYDYEKLGEIEPKLKELIVKVEKEGKDPYVTLDWKNPLTRYSLIYQKYSFVNLHFS
jgi:hypothetical protein